MRDRKSGTLSWWNVLFKQVSVVPRGSTEKDVIRGQLRQALRSLWLVAKLQENETVPFSSLPSPL